MLMSIWQTLKLNEEVNLIDRKWCKNIYNLFVK
jgi:hypothetical protein